MKAAPANSVLVVDDEPDLRTLYELTLVREGYAVDTAGSVDEAWALLGERAFAAVITDMRLPDGSGLELLQRLEQHARAEKAIVITAYGSAQGAVEALKCGAYDYLTKPVDLRQFRAVVASALGRAVPAPAVKPPAAAAALARDSAAAPSGMAAAAPAWAPAAPPPRRRASDAASMQPAALQRLVGASASMQQVHAMVAKVARSMAPVLVHGESGTGKELVARAVHELSARAGLPFVAVNCGAIPENLLEAEFFGYRKGAFTGAVDDRDGFFQAAQGGTLFLDEIGDLPLAMQSKLLRVIQERAVRPVGAVAETPINVRIVSATHRDLGAEVHAGRFRQDLYYRLNVIGIRLPPLRERVADLQAICDAVLARIAADAGVAPAPTISAAALQRLARHAFPGNVRELENLLQRALALSGGDVVELADLGLVEPAAAADELLSPPPLPAAAAAPTDGLAALPAGAATAVATGAALPNSSAALPTDLQAHLDAVERDILLRALERYRYNRTAAGASLGLTLRQMRYRMARLGVIAGDSLADPL